MTQDTERAAPCPFCGSTDISDGEVLSQNPKTGRTVTQSECRSCHAVGPEAELVAGDPDYGDVKAIAKVSGAGTASAGLPGSADDNKERGSANG